jgi:hypothetical protein
VVPGGGIEQARDRAPSERFNRRAGKPRLPTFAERLIEACGAPARIKHVPLRILRVVSRLARPFSPV